MPGHQGGYIPASEEEDPFLLDPELALGRELVLNAVLELLSQLSLTSDGCAQREREEPGLVEASHLVCHERVGWRNRREVQAQSRRR